MLKKIAVVALLLIIAVLSAAILNTLTPTAAAEARADRFCGLPGVIAHEPPPSTDTGTPPIEMIDSDDVGTTISMVVSGYTSTPGQTDGTPCIASDLTNICKRKARGELLCAASREFPLGARLKIPGLGTCTIADYMPADRRASADWYFGQDTGGSKEKFKKAMTVDPSTPRQVKIVSVPE